MILLCCVVVFATSACSLFGWNQQENTQSSYEVGWEYFGDISFEKRILTNANLETGTSSYVYAIFITSTCQRSLYAYSASVLVYGADYKQLYTKTLSFTRDVAAGAAFTFELDVPASVYQAMEGVTVDLSGYSHASSTTSGKQSNSTNKNKQCTVTLVYDNGSPNGKVTVTTGETMATPRDPVKTNYRFDGWYTDQTYSVRYDFSRAVTVDMVLFAKYSIDATTLTNKISTELMKGIVKVYLKDYNTFLGIETDSKTSQGSGFCFYSNKGYYYIITNCHVAKQDSSYDKHAYTVVDYQGNSYTAYLHKKGSTNAISSSYDLACLYFKSSKTNVRAIDLGTTDPAIGDDVISLGAPEGQSNAISYGKVLNYTRITLDDTKKSRSNVTFNVIKSDAHTDHGSSGGPILNADLKVVGVSYAGSTDYSYSIPLSKMNEFLKAYVYD